ncbi:MAG TPA: hypothetical protein VN046_10760 [Stenotrophobium sp.]|jgi:hypothetical protein|nr:hypothetical protein [Stenotrophobium sp.]
MNPKILTLGLLLGMTACAATAADDQPPPPKMQGMCGQRPPPPHDGAMRAAMDHLLATEFAKRSGRKIVDVSALLAQSPPPQVAQQLGLSHDDMRAAMQAAQRTMTARLLAAGLIDSDDVRRLQQEPARSRQDAGERPQRGSDEPMPERQ